MEAKCNLSTPLSRVRTNMSISLHLESSVCNIQYGLYPESTTRVISIQVFLHGAPSVSSAQLIHPSAVFRLFLTFHCHRLWDPVRVELCLTPPHVLG